MKKLLVLSSCIFLMFNCRGADSTIVKSPDGMITFSLYESRSNETPGLSFAVKYRRIAVIERSPLVFTIDGRVITDHAEVVKKTSGTQNETFPIYGVHNTARNYYNDLRVGLNSDNIRYEIDIRVFNDGAAFRFSVTGDKMKRIPDEETIFTLPSESILWYHDMEMHYESVHVKNVITEIPEGMWAAPPATIKLPQGIYAAITEADLLHYPGMSLQKKGSNGLQIRLPQHQRTSYPYRLRYSAEDTLRLLQPAVIEGNIITPWRVIMIGKDLNAMVNNDMIVALNPKPDPKLFPKGIQTAWIRPGRAVWKYLNGGGDGTPDVMKHFTDGAAALGFEHNILEGFWTRWTDEQLKDLVDYSAKKGVGIWLWKHSKSLRNPASRDSFFKKCHLLGITGVKIDFFDHEAKEVIDLYESILKETAKYHLLVDFHGADKPTGLSRTFPNEMTREAVKGMEASKLADRATHETTIPFTRLLAGPAEYTVVHFGERRKNTTWAHQVASAAILSAPLLTYAANPDTLLMNPAVDIIKKIPAVWDETIVLPPSEIGELAVYARRKGTMWCVAVMNGTEAKKIRIPLNFLNGKYSCTSANDDASNPASIVMDNKIYASSDFLILDLQPGGGYIGIFSK